MLLYLLFALLSITSISIGFYSEIVNGNIAHLRNGREPNAGAALFPTIPVIPALHFGVACGLNLVYENLGWYVIFSYFGIAAILRVVTITKLNREFKRLNDQRSSS